MKLNDLKKKALGVRVAKKIASGEGFDLKKEMEDVGLSKRIPQTEVISSPEFQEVVERHLEKLDGLLETSYALAKEKAYEGSFRDHVVAVKTFTETKRLLENKSTANISISAVLDALE
jgi:hypothetical protein